MTASNMLSRANTLVNVGYGEDLGTSYTELGDDPRSGYTDLRSNYTNDPQSDCAIPKNSLVNAARKLTAPLEKLQEENIDEEKEILNKRGQKYLNKLYINNEEFRYEIINLLKSLRP